MPGIDPEAGPTEIMILADESAHPAYVAAHLLSQAEHEPSAAALLVPRPECRRNCRCGWVRRLRR
jgi:histidinol dehydrogenase